MDELKNLWNEEIPATEESAILGMITRRNRNTLSRFISEHSRMIKIIGLGISASLIVFLLASDWLSEPGTPAGFIKLLSVQVMLAVFFLGMNANIRTIDAGDNLRKRLGIMITKVRAVMWGEIGFILLFYPVMVIIGAWISGRGLSEIPGVQSGWLVAGVGLQLLMAGILFIRYSGIIKELKLEQEIYLELKKDQP